MNPANPTPAAAIVRDSRCLRASLSRNLNLTDRLYLVLLASLDLGLLLLPRGRIANGSLWIVLNLMLLVAVVFLAAQTGRGRAWHFLHAWYPLIMFIVLFEQVAQLSFLFRSGWQDHYVLAFEERLFAVPPTAWLGRFRSPLVSEILNLGYFSYFVLLMIVGGVLYTWGNQRAFRQVMDANVIAYLICYVFFLIFPTEGPAHTLPPEHTPRPAGPFYGMVALIQKYAGVHGNAFPSSHVAAGVVALLFARLYVPRLGIALTPLVILLCAGAVYDGYHYVTDVAAGALVGLIACVIAMQRRPIRRQTDIPQF